MVRPASACSTRATDIFMPDMDGIELIKRLKHSNPQTKIIAMTGGGERQMMEIASVAKHLGAIHILQKPFENESLLAAVNAALDTPSQPRSQPDT